MVKRELFIDAELGNGFLYLLRNEFAEPESGLLLDPTVTTVNDSGMYETWLNKKKYVIPPDDVIHLRNAGDNNGLGDSLFDIARKARGFRWGSKSIAMIFQIGGNRYYLYLVAVRTQIPREEERVYQ